MSIDTLLKFYSGVDAEQGMYETSLDDKTAIYWS